MVISIVYNIAIDCFVPPGESWSRIPGRRWGPLWENGAMSDGSERSAWLSSMNNEWDTQEHMVSERYGESMGKFTISDKFGNFWQFRRFSQFWWNFKGILKANLALWQNLDFFGHLGNFCNFWQFWWILGKFGGFGKFRHFRHFWQIWPFLAHLGNFGNFGQIWEIVADKALVKPLWVEQQHG